MIDINIKTYLDTSFGNGNSLLFHGLVDSHLIFGVHLVKLIDQADASVSQHQRAALQRPLARDGVFRDGGGEPHGARTLAGGVHCTRGRGLGVLEELRLRRTWVTDQQHVDVTPAHARRSW